MPAISPAANALLRTTAAFTVCHGSDAHNVLPQEAYVLCNVRYSHHQPQEESYSLLRNIAKKYDVEMEIIEDGIPSPLSSYDSPQFKLIEEAVSATYENTETCPYIMNQCSDSRFIAKVCDDCIRFAPFLITSQQMSTIHGLNENIDIDTLDKAVDFYKYVMTHI